MKKNTIKDIGLLANLMYENARTGKNVTAILFYKEAISLIKELLSYDSIIPEAFEIAPEDWDNYDREYYVQLGNNMTLAIERSYRDKYIWTFNDITYIDKNASSDVIKMYDHDVTFLDFNIEINNKCSFGDEIKKDDEDDFTYDKEKLDKLITSANIEKDEKGDLKEITFDLNLFLDYLFS